MPYPDPFHDFDPSGYYKPKPLLGVTPAAGHYFHEYPRNPNFFAFDPDSLAHRAEVFDESK